MSPRSPPGLSSRVSDLVLPRVHGVCGLGASSRTTRLRLEPLFERLHLLGNTQLDIAELAAEHAAAWLYCRIDLDPQGLHATRPVQMRKRLAKRLGVLGRHTQKNVGAGPEP